VVLRERRRRGGIATVDLGKARCQAAVIGKARDGATKQNSPEYEVQDGEKRGGRREDANNKGEVGDPVIRQGI
jgi:hypothetical protein